MPDVIRLSHADLEIARNDPAALRERLKTPPRYAGPSRKRYLGWAIRKHYHSSGLETASRYVREHFGARGFTSESVTRFLSYLDGYDRAFREYEKRLVDVIRTGARIGRRVAPGCVLTGEIDRIDLTQDGYAVWLFDLWQPDWRNQLRMPVLQWHFAQELGAPLSEVTVGFYSYEDRRYDSVAFGRRKVLAAVAEAGSVAASLSSS